MQFAKWSPINGCNAPPEALFWGCFAKKLCAGGGGVGGKRSMLMMMREMNLNDCDALF